VERKEEAHRYKKWKNEAEGRQKESRKAKMEEKLIGKYDRNGNRPKRKEI
jgi:hypothetical protein